VGDRTPDQFHVRIPDHKWFEENVGCEDACPVNTRAPQYISAIREENYNLAFELNRGDNLFPAVLGRICVHPCEEKCRRGLLIDLPISICSLKKTLSLQRSWPSKKTHRPKGREKGCDHRCWTVRTLCRQRSLKNGLLRYDL
jgi:formate dehydrogenase major subunit